MQGVKPLQESSGTLVLIPGICNSQIFVSCRIDKLKFSELECTLGFHLLILIWLWMMFLKFQDIYMTNDYAVHAPNFFNYFITIDDYFWM